MDSRTTLIIESLRTAPLLVGDLPGACTLDRSLFEKYTGDASLNFEQKLGHLYEQAMHLLINSSDRLALHASHLQVFDSDVRTLGELDFLLQEQVGGQQVHLELAVKFYLAVKDGSRWRFPGPDARDNWQRKLKRLCAHQLQLSRRPETCDLLRARFGIDSVSVRQLIYGCLFHPIACKDAPQLDQMSPDARTGRWLYPTEWAQHFHGVEDVLLIPKPLWPVELTPAAKCQFESISVSRLHVLAAERCTMFCLVDSAEPYFLVPQDWPGTTGRHDC